MNTSPSQPNTTTDIDLDYIMDLVFVKIEDHHLKAQFRGKVEAALHKWAAQEANKARIDEVESLAITIDNTRNDMELPDDETSSMAIKLRLLRLTAEKGKT
jgi:hypothetical protein